MSFDTTNSVTNTPKNHSAVFNKYNKNSENEIKITEVVMNSIKTVPVINLSESQQNLSESQQQLGFIHSHNPHVTSNINTVVSDKLPPKSSRTASFSGTNPIITSTPDKLQKKTFSTSYIDEKEEAPSLDDITKLITGSTNTANNNAETKKTTEKEESKTPQKTKKSFSDKLFGPIKHGIEAKAWVKSGNVLWQVELCVMRQLKLGNTDPNGIIKVFLKEKNLLGLLEIPTKIQNAAQDYELPILRHFNKEISEGRISTPDEFLKAFKQLKTNNDRSLLLSFIGGDEVIACLKQCTQNKTHTKWEQHATTVLKRMQSKADKVKQEAESVPAKIKSLLSNPKIDLPSGFDKGKTALIKGNDIIDNFRSVYSSDFKNDANNALIVINGKGVQIPEEILQEPNRNAKEKRFMTWLITELNATLGVSSNNAITNSNDSLSNEEQADLLFNKTFPTHEHWLATCQTQIPCFHILQATSVSAFAPAELKLRSSYPELFTRDDSSFFMNYLPTDMTRLEIGIDSQTKSFIVTQKKPYTFINGNTNEYTEAGKLNAHFAISGKVMGESEQENKSAYTSNTTFTATLHFEKFAS